MKNFLGDTSAETYSSFGVSEVDVSFPSFFPFGLKQCNISVFGGWQDCK